MKFIINARELVVTRGGSVCLHYLGDILRDLGHTVYIHPADGHSLSYIKEQAIHDQCITIYPEGCAVNPFDSPNVVRWLLHSDLTIKNNTVRKWGSNDLILNFDNSLPRTLPGEQLKVDYNLTLRKTYINKYKNHNHTREGTCYSIRKGALYDLECEDLHESDSICIDDLRTHEQVAKVFNKCKRFISYDPYSYYSTYASLAGCESIVVPIMGRTKHSWRPEEVNRYGISYGDSETELQYASQTKEKLVEHLVTQQQEHILNVKNFIEYANNFFNHQNSN